MSLALPWLLNTHFIFAIAHISLTAFSSSIFPHAEFLGPQHAAWEVLFQGVDPNLALQGVRTQGPFIAYLAIVTTALTNWMQALGQKSVPAERAAVIYAMDPVYAAGFAYLLLGETLGATGLAGAAIITAAAVWSQQQQAAGDSSRGGDIGSRV